jgi:hypothetical protein
MAKQVAQKQGSLSRILTGLIVHSRDRKASSSMHASRFPCPPAMSTVHGHAESTSGTLPSQAWARAIPRLHFGLSKFNSQDNAHSDVSFYSYISQHNIHHFTQTSISLIDQHIGDAPKPSLGKIHSPLTLWLIQVQ